MSTPSTATATFAPHHSHYAYPHHQNYHDNVYSTGNTLPTSHSRLTASYNTVPGNISTPARNSTAMSRQPPSSTAMAPSQSTSALREPSRRDRRPDWHEFYKNGPPKEIIVIDDDSPPPQSKTTQDGPARQPASKEITAHTNKKRKTGPLSTFDNVSARQQASYSNTQTPLYGDSGSNTISTDRTTSLQTTAPTSLGSHGSGGSGTYLEDAVVGQKRKRVTRQQTAEEKKKKEIEIVGDAYSSYVPPPKPPIKAKDVYVQPLKDVGSLRIHNHLQVANIGIVSSKPSEGRRR